MTRAYSCSRHRNLMCAISIFFSSSFILLLTGYQVAPDSWPQLSSQVEAGVRSEVEKRCHSQHLSGQSIGTTHSPSTYAQVTHSLSLCVLSTQFSHLETIVFTFTLLVILFRKFYRIISYWYHNALCSNHKWKSILQELQCFLLLLPLKIKTSSLYTLLVLVQCKHMDPHAPSHYNCVNL